MRSMILAALAVAALVGCSDDGGSNPPPAVDASNNPTPDAPNNPTPDAPPSGANALGQVCDPANMASCPAGNACVLLQGIGSQTMGYCSPACMNNNALCADGYTGPAGGQQQCAVTEPMGSTPNRCVMICADQPQCPTGLTCTQVPMQQVKICVVPA